MDRGEFLIAMQEASDKVDWDFVERVNKVTLDNYEYLFKNWGDSHEFILIEELSELAEAYELKDRDGMLEEIADVVIASLAVRYELGFSIRDKKVELDNLTTLCTLFKLQQVIIKYQRTVADVEAVKNATLRVFTEIKVIMSEFGFTDSDVFKAINVKNNRNAKRSGVV